MRGLQDGPAVLVIHWRVLSANPPPCLLLCSLLRAMPRLGAVKDSGPTGSAPVTWQCVYALKRLECSHRPSSIRAEPLCLQVFQAIALAKFQTRSGQ